MDVGLYLSRSRVEKTYLFRPNWHQICQLSITKKGFSRFKRSTSFFNILKTKPTKIMFVKLQNVLSLQSVAGLHVPATRMPPPDGRLSATVAMDGCWGRVLLPPPAGPARRTHRGTRLRLPPLLVCPAGARRRHRPLRRAARPPLRLKHHQSQDHHLV